MLYISRTLLAGPLFFNSWNSVCKEWIALLSCFIFTVVVNPNDNLRKTLRYSAKNECNVQFYCYDFLLFLRPLEVKITHLSFSLIFTSRSLQSCFSCFWTDEVSKINKQTEYNSAVFRINYIEKQCKKRWIGFSLLGRSNF